MQLQKYAFTLVELVVVITILWVLSTIGFISYTGYLAWARDSNRTSQLTKLSDALQVSSATKSLPLPDDSIEIQASGSTIAYQWYLWENVLEIINYTNGGTDPKDDSYYTYYLTKDRKNLQLMALMEESESLQTHNTLTNPLIPNAYAADYSERYPKVYGQKLWVLVSNDPATLNTPAQEITSSAIELTTTTDYTAYLSDQDTIEGTNTWALLTTIPNASCNRIKQTGWARWNGIYTINPNGTKMQVYCDMETDGGGWTLVANIQDTNANTTSASYQNGIWTVNLSNLDSQSWIIDVDIYSSLWEMIAIEMWQLREYFKPSWSYTIAEMLVSHNKHLYSEDGKSFVAPTYNTTHFGWSSANWPSYNLSGDSRTYLTTWWTNSWTGYSGCCNYTKDDTTGWWKKFRVWLR